MEDLDEEKKLTIIMPQLYLSCLESAGNHQILKDYSINIVLSLMDTEPTFDRLAGVNYYFIKIEETLMTDFMLIFPKALEIIESSLENKCRILVHCNQGIFHSPIVVMCYIMKKKPHSTLIQVINYIRKRRVIFKTVKNFLAQIQLFSILNFKLDLEQISAKIYFFNCWYRNSSYTGVEFVKWIEYWKLFYNFRRININYPRYFCYTCQFELFDEKDIIKRDERGPSKIPVFYIFPVPWICRDYYIPSGIIRCPYCYVDLGDVDWSTTSHGQEYCCEISSTISYTWYAYLVFSIDTKKVKQLTEEGGNLEEVPVDDLESLHNELVDVICYFFDRRDEELARERET